MLACTTNSSKDITTPWQDVNHSKSEDPVFKEGKVFCVSSVCKGRSKGPSTDVVNQAWSAHLDAGNNALALENLHKWHPAL